MNFVARLAGTAVLFAIAGYGSAQPWIFDALINVTANFGDGIFHHLESSGRRHVAVSGASVAVVWEDDHDGSPRIYLARKGLTDQAFEEPVRLSGVGEAYEPSLAAVAGDRFVVAWEEDGRIRARVAAAKRLGPTVILSEADAAQPSVAVDSNRVYLLRSQREGRFSRIRLKVLNVDDSLVLASRMDCAVDAAPPVDDQLYPVAAVAGAELVAAWEDRRPGHSIIMASVAVLEDACAFRAPVRVSDPLPGPPSTYGKGHGATRVALAAFGEKGLMAVWADKRNYETGYDIYAARYLGDGRFGADAKVQDEFGDFARQWHPAIAGGIDGRLVAAWTDEREGDGDIMLSWLDGGEWSEDMPLAGASGEGQQTHPSIAIDAEGNLHAAWIERAAVDGATRLRYQRGVIKK